MGVFNLDTLFLNTARNTSTSSTVLYTSTINNLSVYEYNITVLFVYSIWQPVPASHIVPIPSAPTAASGDPVTRVRIGSKENTSRYPLWVHGYFPCDWSKSTRHDKRTASLLHLHRTQLLLHRIHIQTQLLLALFLLSPFCPFLPIVFLFFALYSTYSLYSLCLASYILCPPQLARLSPPSPRLPRVLPLPRHSTLRQTRSLGFVASWGSQPNPDSESSTPNTLLNTAFHPFSASTPAPYILIATYGSRKERRFASIGPKDLRRIVQWP